VRVIAGRFRGRLLQAPPGTTTRPITDRVKETLFNILGHRFGTLAELPAFDVLDVFAGTGGLGIEALSRGARLCIFVERDRRALRALRENLRQIRIEEQARLVAENAWTLRLPRDTAFGLVFVDPPYVAGADPLRVTDLLDRLGTYLQPDGILIYRHEAATHLASDALRTLQHVDERRVGRMGLDILVRNADGPPPVES
jgi:16S rRNA (guanine966-N2)-methyltransferase